MNPAVEYIIHRKFHQRLPHFAYSPLATDKLTQLYATWQFACDRMHRIALRTPPSTRIVVLCKRVAELHKRRFLKAFAKAHPLPESKDSDWAFGSAKGYRRCGPRVRAHAAALYKAYRYWRLHQPNLP